MNFLERTYFYDKNMVKDEIIPMAGNCYQQLMAIIMKNILKDEDINYSDIFLKDLSFCVRIANNSFLRSSIKGNITPDKKLYTCQDIKIKNEVIQEKHSKMEKHLAEKVISETKLKRLERKIKLNQI